MSEDMKKKISIVTGATGGLGREFVRRLLNEDIDEIWAVARNVDKLKKLKEDYGDKIIIVTTVACPGWIKTELLEDKRNGKQIQFPAIALAEDVAAKILKDAKRGKDMSVYGIYVKWMHLLSNIFPHKLVMRTWVKQIKEYI